MGDWVKLPSGKFLNLDKYAGPDLDSLAIDKVDTEHVNQQLGIRALHRAERLRCGPFRQGSKRHWQEPGQDTAAGGPRDNGYRDKPKARIR